MTFTDEATVPEAMTVLDEAIGLLDDVVCALYTARDGMDAEHEFTRETIALAADAVAQAWATAQRGRQTLRTDLPTHLLQSPPAITAQDAADQADAALEATGRWTVRAARRCNEDETWLICRPNGAVALTVEGPHAAAMAMARAQAEADGATRLTLLDRVLT